MPDDHGPRIHPTTVATRTGTRDALADLHGDQARTWNTLLDFSRSMARIEDLDTILRRMVMAAAEMTGGRRVSIMLPDETQEFLRISCSLGIDEATKATTQLAIGQGVAGTVFATGRRHTADDADDRPGTGSTFASIPIIATLNATDESVGVLNVTSRYHDRPFEDWELEFLDILASVAGSAIDDSLWRQTRDALLKYERDHHLARRIQQSTFPRTLPRTRGVAIDAWSEPAEQTAGDTYDIVAIDDPNGAVANDDAGRVVMLLADATGHGVGPALSVTQLRAMLRMALRLESDLTRIVRHMNEQLCEDLPGGRFITAWIGELDPAARTLTCTSAGQGPILRYDARADIVDIVPADTIPLGIVPDLDLRTPTTIDLCSGDIVAVLSDGIFDATNSAGDCLGVERVSEMLRAGRAERPDQLIEQLRALLTEFTEGVPADDDRTAIFVKGL